MQMPPQNPAVYRPDKNGRLVLNRQIFANWLYEPTDEVELFCVPIVWKYPGTLPIGHELEGWIVWEPKAAEGEWVIDPQEVLGGAAGGNRNFHLQSLMYPARLDAKNRLGCAGLFNALFVVAGAEWLWVAPEKESISVWTNLAYQQTYARLHAF
jgi:hypothetical protein